jgi:hypothetical protein
MTRVAAVLVMIALALVGPAAALCDLRCATQETQAAGGAPMDACAGHDGHSSTGGVSHEMPSHNGGNKNCGGHARVKIEATAPARIIFAGSGIAQQVAIIPSGEPLSPLSGYSPPTRISFLSKISPHDSIPLALRI